FTENKAGYTDPTTKNVSPFIDTQGSGGAIYSTATGGIIDSTDPYNKLGSASPINTFTNNTAGVTPTSGTYGGGAIYFGGNTLNLSIAVFNGNTAPNASGGAIYVASTTNPVSISDTEFTTNNAADLGSITGEQGTVLFLRADTNITRTSFGSNGT